jgi:adenylate cyclase
MTRAVFLSYASQDADAARRICDALRAQGLEVWFDQSELRGGDAWDASIRKQIKECALFVPMISANTNARSEGYFRLEWKLAVDRSHLMADDATFFVPVMLDAVEEASARVPDKFRERQWSRLEKDEAFHSFAARVTKLLGDGVQTRITENTTNRSTVPMQLGERGVSSSGYSASIVTPAASSSFASTEPAIIPSIAVLAFANRSASADDEYFSDGLADELLNVLAKINGLRVAARTSAFSFKGKQTTVEDIGRILSVATVLEGSVRKSGNRVRISVQLIKTQDGFQLWSETYDRTMDDIFALQDDIAQAVVTELREKLLGETTSTSKIAREVGSATGQRTENAEAHALFLHGRFLIRREARDDYVEGIRQLREALALDANHADAMAWLSIGLCRAAAFGIIPMAANEEVLALAERAISINSESVTAHAALLTYDQMVGWNWTRALATAETMLSLAGDDADVCLHATMLFNVLGERERALALAQKAAALDPLRAAAYIHLGRAYDGRAGQWAQKEATFRKALELSPQAIAVPSMLAFTVAKQGRHDEAIQLAQSDRAKWAGWQALSLIYAMAGNHAASDEALNALLENDAKAVSEGVSSSAFQIAGVYAERNDLDRAFHQLDRAFEYRDAGLSLAISGHHFVNLHADPRWKLFLKKMGKPE